MRDYFGHHEDVRIPLHRLGRLKGADRAQCNSRKRLVSVQFLKIDRKQEKSAACKQNDGDSTILPVLSSLVHHPQSYLLLPPVMGI
jgi:hypothetical protein